MTKAKVQRAVPVISGKWTMADECRFIDNLGSYASTPNSTPEDLLEGYIKGCKLRKSWDRLDKKKVIRYAKAQLKKMRK
jgi:hypothetical protein